MAAKVALLNRLKAALRSEAGEADEIQLALNEWRVKALSVLLIVIAVAALPSYGVSILGAIHSQQLTFPLLIYPIAYLTFVILALSSRLSFRAKVTIFFLLAYTNAIASFARLGLAGSGRLYLLTLPVIATLLIGARTGFITAALSLAIYAVFALLAHFGVVANWLTEPTNPLNLSFWLDAGLALSVFLVIVVVLLERFSALQERTLVARQQAIIDLEQTTRMLREREERLETVMAATNDGIWDWDLRTNEVYYSPRWKSMLGYAEDEIIDRFESWRALMHPDDVKHAIGQVQAYLAGQSPAYELEHRLRHKDGSYRWILARGIALRDPDGQPYRLIGSHSDITERRYAEDALRSSEAEMRALLAAMTDVIFVLDAAGRYLKIAPTNPTLLYRPHEQLVGRTLHQVFDRAQADVFLHTIQDALETQRSINFEYCLPIAGREACFAATVAPMNGGSVVWVARDITERKQAEYALEKRLAFEKLITDISTEFINLGPQEIDAGIQHALKSIGEFDGTDRSYVFEISGDGATLTNTHEWCAAGIEPMIDRVKDVSVELFPWLIAHMNHLEVVHIPRVADLPDEARFEKEEFQSQSIQSLITVPMVYRGSLMGFVGCDAVRQERTWTEDSIALLRLVGEIFANALEHKRAQAIQAGQRQFLELLATGGNFSEILHTLVRIIEEQWPGMLGLVLLLDEDGKHLHIGAAVSLPEDYVQSIEGLEIGPLVGSCGTACYRRERVIVEDILTDPRWDGLRDLAVKHRLRACWSEPVFSATGQVVGTFAMYYRRPRAPTEPELRVIETAAHLVGIAIEHKRAQEALRLANQTLEQRVGERTKELATLNAIAAMVSRSLNLEEVLSAALDKTMEVIGTEAGAAYRLEEANQELILMAQRGLSDDFVHSTTHLALEVALAGKTVNTRQPLIWDIARDYPESELKQQIQREGLQLIIGVPLLAKDRLVGSLVLSTHAMRTLTPEESSMLMAIGQQVGVAVENARLFEERTRSVNNLSQLYQANLALSASVELDEMLRHVSRVAREISEADAVSLHIYDEATDSFTQAYALGVTGDWSPTHVRRTGMTRRVIHEGTPILVDDTLDNPEVNPHTIEAGLRSLIATPLVSQGKPVGVMYVGSFSPHRFDADDVQWVSALANQAAVAIANARLYEAARARHAEAERRRQVAEGLREILAVLNSRQSLEETLDFIVSQACRLMRCDAASILQLQSDGWLKIRSACGLDADYVANMRLPLGGGGAGRALAGHQPVTLSDARVFAAALARESDAAASQELAAIERTMSRGYYALLSVPLIIKDEDYGAITLYYREAREFSEEESRLASSVAHQAALAIESARLREQAEQSAAMAERSRLARELHDSVTQSLYSITLYAEAAARLSAMGKNIEAADHLRELRDTSQEALREMRLLIFELRPPALEKSGLIAALQARLDAVEVRGGMQAELQVEGQEQLPHVLQEELYHITQEALNNVLKHARARHVKVHVQFSEAGTSLEVCDDGVGFDPALAYTQGGLGLRGMNERAQKIGAALNVESVPGQGTQVCIQVSAPPQE